MGKIQGKGAKRKGSRAEIKLRNLLRRIYPTEKRNAVFRVPLSGAGAMKGDVFDGNDYDSCYEVKCHEKLSVPQWWRQTTSQAGTSRTPVLAITASYRPFLFIIKMDYMMELVDKLKYEHILDITKFNTCANLFNRMAELEPAPTLAIGQINIDGEDLAVIREFDYLNLKKLLLSN